MTQKKDEWMQEDPNVKVPVWTEADQKMMDEMYESMAAYDREVERSNKRLCKAILNQLGTTFLKEIMAVAHESEVQNKMEIVRETTGEYQKEYGYDCFEGYWVDQWSVGDSGDSFNGYIYIQLKENRWLKMYYSC